MPASRRSTDGSAAFQRAQRQSPIAARGFFPSTLLFARCEFRTVATSVTHPRPDKLIPIVNREPKAVNSTMNSIMADSLTKHFAGDIRAVDGIDLAIDDGQVFG